MHARRLPGTSAARALEAPPARWNGKEWVDVLEAEKPELRSHLGTVPGGQLAAHVLSCAYCAGRVLVLTPAEVARLPRPRAAPGE